MKVEVPKMKMVKILSVLFAVINPVGNTMDSLHVKVGGINHKTNQKLLKRGFELASVSRA